MTSPRARLEQLRRWRQAAVWAPVLWFPIVLTAFAMAETRLAIAGLFAGLIFTGIGVAVVWFARCPGCSARFGESSEMFRRFWDDASCLACALSLFELRRENSDSGS